MSILVNVDNYARAEVAFQADRLITGLGGEMNGWVHFRQPTPLNQQTVIRMNRGHVLQHGNRRPQRRGEGDDARTLPAVI
jgi:hypothetical protein